MVRTLHATCSRLSLRWGLAILLLSVLTMPAAVPRRVLIIHSFGRDFAPLDTMSSAFRTELAQQSPEPVEFFEVSILSARFAEGGSDAPLLDYLRTLFAGRRLDLIFPVAEPAMHFCVRHRAGFFPETPLLAHVDHRQLPVVLAATNATMTPVYIKIPVLMENILNLRPDTTNVFMILGSSPFERLWADQCSREFATFTNRVAIHYASDLPLAGIRDRVATLPPRSAVLYAMLAVDAAGVPYEQEKALGTIHAAANAPVFGVFESQLGQGILGGPLLSLEDSGKQAAHTALRLLRGVKPGEIAIPPPDPVRFSYDWRELRRWNISEAQLAPGSEVRFRVPTFWEQYKWRLITIHVVCLVEALLIFGLVRSRQRLRRAQRDLDERLRLEALAAALGAAFVNLPPERVDREIESWMARMIETLEADRIGLFEFHTDQTLARNTHQATRPGVPRHTEEFAVAHMRWYLGELRAGNAVVLNDLITDLPPAATAEREFARKHGTRAVMGFPLQAAGRTVRAIDCVLVNRSRVWSAAAQDTVRLIGQIFALALERRETEKRLRASEERLSLATASARIGVWSWNIPSERVEASTDCKQMFGWTAGDSVTYTMFLDRLHAGDRDSVQRAVDSAVRNQMTYDTEYRIVLPDGTIRWIAARGCAQYQNGQARDMLGVVLDITDRKRAEAEAQRQRAELAHVARVSTMGELAASVAHELNQPLGAILSNAEAAELFLNQNPPALNELRDILVDIRKDDERASEVIRRMRALLQKREMELRPLDLNSVVEDVFRVVSGDATLRKTTLAAELSPRLPPVRGDRIHLQQVLLNLTMNAMEAMAKEPPEKRRLAVRTSVTSEGAAEVSVTDSGPGLDPANLSHLFEPFFTTKPNGMGMGLSISRRIVEAHHGRICAENSPAGGATFRFILPVAPEGRKV